MKKLISRLVLLGVIVAAIIAGMNEIYKNGYYLNVMEGGKFQEIPLDIQLANLGNSHGGGFVYDDYREVTTFNFSMGSQPLICDYLLLKNYREHLSKNAVVFVEVSYFDLYRTISESTDEEMLKRYYFILEPENNPWYTVKDDFLYHYFPVLAIHPDNLVKVSKNILDFYLKRNKNSAAPADEKSEDTILLERNIDAIAAARVEQHYRYCQLNKGNMDLNEMQALHDILDLCQENGWRPIIITTPYTAQYTSYWPEEVLKEMRKYLDNIAQEYGIEYLDYSQNPDYADDLSLFIDSDHMNSSGAQKFSAELKDYIYKKGYLKETE